MVITVENYAEIRQRHNAGESKRSIARALGVSRNTVDKYCAGETVPWERKKYSERPSKVMNQEAMHFIRDCLAEDEREGLCKQTHTAKRIYDRLIEECGFRGGESTVRRTVSLLKNTQPEVFLPLAFSPGEAMQVDWGEATVYIQNRKHTVQLFCARLCASCAPIVFAFERQNEESFLEGFTGTFAYFGGVPKRIIFDNARVAVKEGFGTHAIAQKRYSALAAHYCFQSVFCNPASGNEKGLVEGLVGWSRRNILVPLPRVESMDELNLLLRDRCIRYLKHTVRGKSACVGDLLQMEKGSFTQLPNYLFDTSKSITAKVDRYCTVRFGTNNYSVPLEHCGHEVAAKGYGNEIKVYFGGVQIALHKRCYLKQQSIFRLEHYLPLLERKPRALLNARPVRDNLPPAMMDWLSELTAKDVMQVLRLCVDTSIQAVWNAKCAGIPFQACSIRPVASSIQDIVTVNPIDLSAYDRMLKGGKAV